MTTIVTTPHWATSALHALDHGLLSTLDHLLRRRAHPRQVDIMLAPHQRAPGSVQPAQTYQSGQHVLAFVANAWHPATILATHDAAAYVRYQVPGIGGTGVETVHAASIAATPNEATAPRAIGSVGPGSALGTASLSEDARIGLFIAVEHASVTPTDFGGPNA